DLATRRLHRPIAVEIGTDLRIAEYIAIEIELDEAVFRLTVRRDDDTRARSRVYGESLLIHSIDGDVRGVIDNELQHPIVVSGLEVSERVEGWIQIVRSRPTPRRADRNREHLIRIERSDITGNQ